MEISELETFLAINPFDPATLINLGKLYLNASRITEATALLERAAEYHPDVFLAQNYLGDAYYMGLQPDKAIKRYERALVLRPGDVDVQTNLSVCHWQIGEFAAAYRYGKIVREQRRVNFGLLSLLIGDYEEGWKHWEYLDTARSVDGLPRWEGEDIHDKRILVLDEEQGFGDTILLARFLPMLADQCKRITFQTRSPLLQLIRQSYPAVNVIAEVEDDSQFDLQVRLFSLPRLFETRLETIPCQPYLHADENDCMRWRAKLAQHGGFKIGLRWAGSSTNPMDQIRSISDLAVLTPLRDVLGVTYVSLAKEASAAPDVPILDFSDDLTDFAQTAALLAALDLVISVDTGVLNLAGAMGVPTWLLNYHGTDWRWGVTGDCSPWYPSIRVFRQPVMGDWASAIAAVMLNLKLSYLF